MVTISGSGHFWSVAHVGRQTGIKIATKHSAFASQILDADGRHWARQPSACPHRSLDITTVSHMVEMEALTLPLVTWSLVPACVSVGVGGAAGWCQDIGTLTSGHTTTTTTA